MTMCVSVFLLVAQVYLLKAELAALQEKESEANCNFEQAISLSKKMA